MVKEGGDLALEKKQITYRLLPSGLLLERTGRMHGRKGDDELRKGRCMG